MSTRYPTIYIDPDEASYGALTHHKLSPTCTRTDRTWTDDDGKTHVAHTWHRTTKTRTPARR